jgi:AcrR family transcriptional regulator
MTLSTGAGAATVPIGAPRSGQRDRILDTALELMSEQGASATSMRQLAKACGVNVAALYHYFPSKAHILRSVIEERQYGLRLQSFPEFDASLPPRERLVALILAMWEGARSEEAIWRLLLGEALRGDETALAVGREILDAIEPALRAWLVELFQERDEPQLDAARVATVVVGQLFSYLIGQLFLPEHERAGQARREAEALAALALPAG